MKDETRNAKTGTLLDKTDPITMDDLKRQFQSDDFSAADSGYDLTRQPAEKQSLYMHVKQLFIEAWEKELKKIGYRGGKNYCADYPLKVLEDSESNLVAGIVMRIMDDPELLDQYMDAGTEAILSRAEEVAVEAVAHEEKTVAAEKIFEKLADKFLSHMMGLLLKAQNVPEILRITKQMPAHEDFSESAKDNRDKIDFERKWDHTRTKTGAMLSLDELKKQEASGLTDIPSGEMSLPGDDVETIIRLFADTLDGKDREIFLLRARGKDQKEIADRLGYKSQGAVSKRLNKLEEKFRKFLRDRS